MKRNFTFLMAAFALMVGMMMPLGMKGQMRATKTEGFEAASTGTNYQGTVTVAADDSDCGIAWQIYYGSVSTTNAITGSNSAALRLYNNNNHYGYLKNTSPIYGLSSVTFKAKAQTTQNALIKVNISYSTDGSTWTNIETDKTLASSANTYTEAIPTGGRYFQIAISSNSTKPSSGSAQLTIDDVTFTYSQVAAPTFSPAAGTYTSAQNVTLSSATSGATIYYTTDGTSPTTSSSVYSSPISVSSTTTIKAFAVKSGMTNSTLATATYNINANPCTITFNAGSGTCSSTTMSGYSGNSITLPTATPSSECANMGWTFAGWATSSIAETTTAPALLTGSYTITGDATLFAVYKADAGMGTQTTTFNFANIAAANNWVNGTQYKTVSISPITLYAFGGGNSGKYYTSDHTWRIYSSDNGGVTVSAVSGNNITAVSSTPSISFTISNGSASFTASTQTNFSSISVTYEAPLYTYATSPICMEQVATPTFNPAAGSFSTAQNVTISCTTSGATIYYTTDGSTPSTSSSVYSSAIPVSSTTTIKAIAVKSGMDNSTVASATYTINLPHTVTFNAGNGTCSQASVTEPTGTSITLPTATPSTTCADAGWTFAGWATSNVDYTTTAPTLYTDSYTINGDATLYAVYSVRSFGEAFNNTGSGDFIIYAAAGNTNYYANGTISNSKIGSTTSASEAAVYTFEKPSGYGDGEYAIKIGTKYIKYTGNTDLGTSNDPYKWAISEGVHGTWRVASGTTGRALIFRAGTSNQFGGYATSNITGEGEYFDLEIGGVGEAAYATSPDCTDITVSESSLSFLYEGGAGSFDFTVSNPISGATASASTTASWLANVAVSGNTVNFQVAYNDGASRSGEITLTYAKNGTTLATATITVNQDANASLPGSAENPYTVADALEVIEDYNDNQTSAGEVYVTGIISKIDEIEVVQYHNAKYYISDDGTTSDQLLSYYGYYINNTYFMSEDELMVGDNVVIKGKLKKYVKNNIDNTTTITPELDRGNYIVSLTRAVQPVTFNPGSCVSPSSVGVNLFTESIFDYDGTKIYYTTNGGDPRTSDGIAFEDASDANLELTQTTTLKAAAYVPELEKWSAVTEATYTIVPEGSSGWQDNPYTVLEALAALDQNSDIKGAYVQGIVSRVIQIDTTLYYNATYYISNNGEENNELYVFRGKYISRADFTSTDQLKPGDQVTVYGDLTIYGNTNPVKEFKPKNYIENWYRPASIMITPDHFEFSSNATSGVIDVIYSSDILVNAYNPTVQFCDADGETATYNWLTVTPSQANDWDLEFIIDANEGDQPRTAYLRVWGRDNQSNDIVSNIISITQSEYIVDFATLDFYFNGGHNDIADTPGLTGAYLGTYAAENTRLKFVNPSANQISMLVLKINEVPGVLTYDIKGNGMEGGTFKVQESSNGLTYSDVASYSGLANNLQSVTIDNLSPSTRYIRWIYVTKNKGNVGVGNIHLYKPIVNYDLVVNNPMDGDTQIGAISANPAGPSIPAGADVALSISYDINSYYFVEWVVTDDSDNPVTVTGSHFTMPAANVTVTATLVSVNTPCAYAFSVNGQMGDQQSGTVGNTIQMPECSNINFNGQTFIFLGWTTNANDIGNLLAVGSSFTLNQDVTFHAVFRQQVSGLEAEKHFAKVTRELQDWSGDYLIVYEDEDVAFNGSLQTLDAASNTVEVTISNGIIIASSDEVNSAKFTITVVEGGYSIKSASGKYIGKDDNDNGMDESTEYDENYVNEISYNYNEEEGEIDIVGSGGAHLRFNSASNQNRFRYYKSSTYTVQEGIQLYKYVGSVSNLYTRIFMNETADNITIEGPSIIPDGSVLNVASITNNLGADRLLVDEGGQLVTSSDVNATVRKTITPYAEEHGTDNYYLIASPVNDLNPATAGMTVDNFDLYAFDQSAQGEEWQNYKADNFNLAAGQGYLYANDYGGFINMGGIMAATANGVTISQASGKPFAGWNLIGNPYPCNVTINKPFYRLAEGGAVLATEATDNTVAIAPMEGVFVYADVTETESFAKAPTTSTTGGRNLLSMRVSRNRNSKDDRVDTDNAIVRFGEGDMLRKLVLNPDLSQLYVEQDGTDYAIVNAEAEGELPVSFRAATNGSYTLSVAAEGVTMRYLHLIDLKTGADVDLLQTPYYTFTAQTTDYESRFRLVFATGSSTSSETGNFAYYNGSQWVVSSEADATLQVVDMMGRVLSSQSINGNAQVSIDRAAGVYLLRLINGSDVKVQKIVIH